MDHNHQIIVNIYPPTRKTSPKSCTRDVNCHVLLLETKNNKKILNTNHNEIKNNGKKIELTEIRVHVKSEKPPIHNPILKTISLSYFSHQTGKL